MQHRLISLCYQKCCINVLNNELSPIDPPQLLLFWAVIMISLKKVFKYGIVPYIFFAPLLLCKSFDFFNIFGIILQCFRHFQTFFIIWDKMQRKWYFSSPSPPHGRFPFFFYIYPCQ